MTDDYGDTNTAYRIDGGTMSFPPRNLFRLRFSAIAVSTSTIHHPPNTSRLESVEVSTATSSLPCTIHRIRVVDAETVLVQYMMRLTLLLPIRCASADNAC